MNLLHRTFKFLVRNSQVLAGVSIATISCWSFLPHTLLLNQYQKVVQQLKDGQPEPLDQYVEKLCDKVHSNWPFKSVYFYL